MASNSIISVTSPLGADAFTLTELRGREELGALFHYEVQLVSARTGIKLTDLVGQDMTVTFDAIEGQQRHIHGFVTKAVGTGKDGRHFTYQVTLEPWLAFLTRNKNCRIFQNTTVPDILKKVLRERGIPEMEEALSGTYSTHEYVVQYRESDFNFLSRLMEREGIYYFFKHDKGKHTLVLADSYGAHQATPGWDKLPYYPPTHTARRERDHIDDWSFSHTMQTANIVLNDYDFKRPSADLNAKVFGNSEHEHDEYETYDYPGEYYDNAPGDHLAGVRFDEARVQTKLFQGSGTVRGLAVGALFTLAEHPRDDQNKEYLVTQANLQLVAGDHDSSGRGDGADLVRCGFNAIEGSKPFRTQRSTPRPLVHGPQTAKVVGKGGKEIWTDEFGRVKVQFHWDREGKSDENSSCWVRVSQVMAGAGWGAMHVPRIGQEVVVSFLEGDPDRPLITGRVYNGTNKPPFGLPGKGMVSGMKSDSTPGGGGNNEISLDDTKGTELINIHGQYDMTTTIEHDQTDTIHNNRTTTVDVNDTENVGAEQSITIGANQTQTVIANQTETVGGNQVITVAGNHALTVGQASAETIALAKALTIGAAYQVSVGAVMNLTVGGAVMQEVGAGKMVTIAGESLEKIGGGKSITIGKELMLKAGTDGAINIGQKLGLNAGDDLGISGKKKGIIKLADELTIKVGSAEIIMKKNGDITIKGKKITIDASGDVIIDGKSIKHKP
jgi:type VI secretion system secreted protein VgrG